MNKTNEPAISTLAKAAIKLFETQDHNGAITLFNAIFQGIRNEPQQLKSASDLSNIGKSLLLMLQMKMSDDIDNLQMIASVAYFCISKEIREKRKNIDLIKDRLQLLQIGHEPLIYTVMSALDLTQDFMSVLGQNAPFEARDAIYKMQIADLYENKKLQKQYPNLKERMNEFEHKINNNFFLPDKSIKNVVKSGLKNHEKLFLYLENKILKNEDVIF